MSDIHLTLSAEENEFLKTLLEAWIVHKRVEIHRTDSLAFRHDLERELDLADGVMKMLKPVARAVGPLQVPT